MAPVGGIYALKIEVFDTKTQLLLFSPLLFFLVVLEQMAPSLKRTHNDSESIDHYVQGVNGVKKKTSIQKVFSIFFVLF